MPKQLNIRCKVLVASLIEYFEQERDNNGPLLPLTAIRRQERESCINNIKISAQSKERAYQNSLTSQTESSNSNTYTRNKSKPPDSRSHAQQNKSHGHVLGSLDNISSNPLGELNYPTESSLRRSRSLAVSRELDIYTNLEAETARKVGEKRRSQLIPRAKLIDRNANKEPRNLTKGRSADNLDTLEPTLELNFERSSSQSDLSVTSPDYTPPPERSEKIQENGNSNENINNENDFDSLDSNYHNKTSINSICKVSYEELPNLPTPNLPNYYPDSKFASDYSGFNSEGDSNSIVSYNSEGKEEPEYQIYDNLEPRKFELDDHESIPYDENITLSPNRPLYNSVTEHIYSKPKTIRGATPFKTEEQYFKPHSLPTYTTPPESYRSEDRDEIDEQDISIEYFENDKNFDEINLNNEKIVKVADEEQGSLKSTSPALSETSCGPLYATIEEKPAKKKNKSNDIVEVTEEKDDNYSELERYSYNESPKDINKTYIEVEAPPKPLECEEYKTIVAVESDNKSQSSEEDRKSKSSSKQHSHNYLKEFLESQKGSTKPLQNFIAKKFSNLSRRNSKETASPNLVSNQFYSLPDISISKNLRKCEKIDRKLRKCEKNTLTRTDSNESRFIVNIGNHFDITANANIPIDFEVKIAKIPKKSKLSKKESVKYKSDVKFLDAVKNLKETLNGVTKTNDINGLTKPEIIALTTKNQSTEISIKDCNRIQVRIEAEESRMEHKECTGEYQEKLGTMRSYWNKMLNGFSKSDITREDETKENDDVDGKSIEIQTKVEDVKKKFEPRNEQEEEKVISKVQMAKQLFEPKPVENKHDKMSPYIKESCIFFENHHNDRDNQFESLNPCSVEILDRNGTSNGDDKTNEESYKLPNGRNSRNLVNGNKTNTFDRPIKKYDHKPLGKSQSDIMDPEFDHVRYRVLKSDLFQKKIFAKCEKESQFDGLMQYLQDYSFQELLRDNNIVIIEPIRSKVHHESSNVAKMSRNITPYLHKKNKLKDGNKNGSGLKKHFFYHPIRVNKEVNDDELPNPDTVKQVRQFFEGTMKRSRSSQDFDEIKNSFTARDIDPDKDRCSATDSTSNPSNVSDFGSQENFYDSMNSEHCCEQQYVSEDILEKIREHGTTVTYYGGRVVKIQNAQPSLTKTIMEEIRNNERKSNDCKCSRRNSKEDNQKFKFKLLKSNSCSSRLELVGTDDLKEAKKKFLAKHKQILRNQNPKTELNGEKEVYEEDENYQYTKVIDKHQMNENIRKNRRDEKPKVVDEEKKMMTQWGNVNNENNYSTITYNSKQPQKAVDYTYHNYDKIKTTRRKCEEMEFEPYEVA